MFFPRSDGFGDVLWEMSERPLWPIEEAAWLSPWAEASQAEQLCTHGNRPFFVDVVVRDRVSRLGPRAAAIQKKK
jgi:hypothetical protein